jgi:hypothetical protein
MTAVQACQFLGEQLDRLVLKFQRNGKYPRLVPTLVHRSYSGKRLRSDSGDYFDGYCSIVLFYL